ncbi:MAG: UvrD-helicase domain-containing protein [Anaerolineae bacterium]|jgi:DNA helicase-2/ATP-dependent DNA helicase PcrA
MNLLHNLNPQQREAVTASEGPVLVLSGPGSGKTRVLTRRVAWLVQQAKVAPWRIMAVTFTNKAAREMRERLEGLLGAPEARRLTLGTFHATCARILRQEGEAIGIPRDYIIFDADDQRTLVRRILKELNLDDEQFTPAAIHSAISRAKNDLIPPEDYHPGTYVGEITRRVYGPYQEWLRANGGLDFDDLLMETTRLFREVPEVTKRYQERYRHILVDEFQDTNLSQYVLLRQLSARHRNLFAVADEDQSIYRWRGADYRNISRLEADHPDLVTYLLEQNYRSTQTILDAAQAIIRRNPNRTDKRLFTDRGAGPKVVVHEAYDQDDEGQFVVNTIAQLTMTEDVDPGDCAVMYRTNAQSRSLEEAFLRAGLPYRLVGATRFYGRREIKDILAYLRLIHNPNDAISLRRIIGVPPRGIGAKTLAALEEGARAEDVPPWDVIEAVAAGDGERFGLRTRAQRAVSDFHELVSNWIAVQDQIPVLDLIDRVVRETGYEAYIKDGTEEGEERWENVLELRSVAADYAELSLTDFLVDVALVSDVDNLTEEVNAPTLLTLHSAKGLEFPVVFITGLEEGLLPHSRSFDDQEEMAEERRLMYVGVTRAKDRLYLTHAFRRTRFGLSEVSEPSRFLDDIPSELIQGARVRTVRQPTKWDTAPQQVRRSRRPKLRFRTGQEVIHPTFGPGLVIESQPDGDDERVTVAFEDGGLKRIMGSYLTPASR